MHNIKVIRVSPHFLLDLIIKQKTLITKVPDDLVLVGCGADEYGIINLTVESRIFGPVKPGEQIPEFKLVHRHS